MPRIRSIKPIFWDDKKISKLSRDARLIFIAMWNFTDDNGAVIADLTWLKSKILPYDELPTGKFAAWIKEIINEDFIKPVKYNNEEYFFINFESNSIAGQVINRPNYRDVFIEKSILKGLLEDSKNNHTPISDDSVHDRIGLDKDMDGIGGDGRKVLKNKKVFQPPTLSEVEIYFNENGYNKELAGNFFKYYDVKNDAGENWVDSRGKKVLNWKKKAISVWFKDTHKLVSQQKTEVKNGIAQSIKDF